MAEMAILVIPFGNKVGGVKYPITSWESPKLKNLHFDQILARIPLLSFTMVTCTMAIVYDHCLHFISYNCCGGLNPKGCDTTLVE